MLLMFQVIRLISVYHKTLTKTSNHLLSVQTSASNEVVFYVRIFPLPEEIKKSGYEAFFVDHTAAVYLSSAAGVPFTAAYIQSKGDVITDMTENLAAEQKARTTYDNIIRLVDEPDVRESIKFLCAREIVHFRRFSEGLRLATDKLYEKNFYAFTLLFDENYIKQKTKGRDYSLP